jgi:outer membrane PBP1 activator LpoA protein
MMQELRWIMLFVTVAAGIVLQGCATDSPQRLINQNDHAALANYYSQEAQQLQQKAKDWDFMAEFYEKHSDSSVRTKSDQHAAHCRSIAQNYRKAAEEATALASEHRAQRPHGMIN